MAKLMKKKDALNPNCGKFEIQSMQRSQEESASPRQAKKRPHENYKFIDYHQRVAIIYDNIEHQMTPLEIKDKYQMKYNTVRWIINKFKQNSRVNIKQKISGYSKRQKIQVDDVSANGNH